MQAIVNSVLTLIFVVIASGCDNREPLDYSGATSQWQHVGGNQARNQYSPLDQIRRSNVDQLEIAWQHNSGDFARKGDGSGKVTAFEASPIVVDDTLYYCTPYNRIFALDPETGAERWVFDPQIDSTGLQTHICRGITYWQDPQAAPDSICSSRIYLGAVDARLLAVDAKTGKPCQAFGKQGEVDLMTGMGPYQQTGYSPTSPPLAINGLLVIGAMVVDNRSTDMAGGVIRAFDARSGELVWAFDPVPPSMTPVTVADIAAGKHFTPSTPNAWSLITGDPERNTVYLPMGNPANDYYGGESRSDLDYYGSSLVALDATNGTVKWHFQAVHHDLWDYDIAAQPIPFTQQTAQGDVPGVLLATKMGHIFLLHADTGEPLFPVEERPVPQTKALGEFSSPTQPFPTKPAPLMPDLTEDDIWGLLSFVDKKECLEKFATLNYEGIFTPPSVTGSIEYPGFVGGVNWGGVSIDPQTNRAVMSYHRFPFVITLVDRDSGDPYVFEQEGAPFRINAGLFGSSFGAPCIKPPWSYMTAIDLNTGEQQWKQPFGTLNNLVPLGQFVSWGGMALGGNIQTAGGLAFIGATMDAQFRAFDTDTGELLWSTDLPYAAHAMPMTYRLRKDSKQFVVIAAGGKGLFESMGSKTGDALIAFALKE